MSNTAPNAELVTALPKITAATDGAGRGVRWGPALEAAAIPAGAVLFALLLFGLFCITQQHNAFAVYGAIYKAAFGSWYALQNTLIRAAPLILTALCTALPARLGLVIIGNEGALVAGGVAAAATGVALSTSAPPLMVQLSMAAAAMVVGGAWIALAGGLRQWRGVNETISSLLLTYI